MDNTLRIIQRGEGFAHIQVGTQDLYIEWSDDGIDYIEVDDDTYSIKEEFAGGAAEWAKREEEARYCEPLWDNQEYDTYRDNQYEKELGIF